MLKKILITGSNGMLGHELVKKYKSKGYDVYGLNRNKDKNLLDKSYVIDITNFHQLPNVIHKIKPDIVLHAAAMVDIELCQKEQSECIKVNFEAIKVLVESISPKTLFIFISTDSVFDGQVLYPSESSKKNPINLYSISKSMAEDFIINKHSNHIIVRTNIYGFHQNWRGSLVEWAISNIQSGKRFGGYTDVYFNPLYTKQLAEAISLLESIDFLGTIHLGSKEKLSKFEFLNKLSETLNFDKSLIFKSSLDSEKCAPRPKHTVLNIAKSMSLLSEFDNKIETGLRLLKDDLERFELNDKNR
jgi:dTDP-4-dehydrorhamnose reductase